MDEATTIHVSHYDPHADERRRGVRIHAIDIVQPPDIGISPITDKDAHQTIVTAALAAAPRRRRRLAAKLARTPLYFSFR